MRKRSFDSNAAISQADPAAAARTVGLRYVSDTQPGICRVKTGRGFRYVDNSGKAIRQEEDLQRIRSLGIPPAWTQVWICAAENGHLQATGHDFKGRKQYRYHRRWREVRDETKFNRMVQFGKALPGLRRRVSRDLKLPGLPRQKVLATVVRLLEVSLIRVGNEEYARENRSFGLTTMRDRHVEVNGSRMRFQFRGKGGKEHEVEINDQRLSPIVKKCQDLPGQDLFQYVDEDGKRQAITSEDVNEYLKETTGQEFTAKDFRTWAGTVLAARALQEFEKVDSEAKAKRNILQAVEAVSQMLGNTPSICRKCYVHPAVLDSYMEGNLVKTLRKRADREFAASLSRLRPEEAAVLALLQRRLADEDANARGRNGSRNTAKELLV
jgi:DNA topoisomerase I